MTTTVPSAVAPAFYAPEELARQQAAVVASARGALLIAGCRSGAYLARRVARCYDDLLAASGSSGRVGLADDLDYQFTSGETCVRLERHVSGCDVFLLQALCDPTGPRSVDQNYMALLIAARTCREHGASHVTAVLPYLAYGRQDKPTEGMREPTTARLMADLVAAAGVDRLVAWHPHCGQLRGFYGSMPVHMLGPLGLFAAEFGDFRGRRDVIVVAPDAGASGLVTAFGRALGLDCAIGSKHRPRTDESEITQVIGDFSGKHVAVVLEDELSTGGSVDHLAARLAGEHGIEEIHLGVSHNRCVPECRERLVALHRESGLRRVVVTNAIPQTPEFAELPFLSVRCLAEPLARVINRIHCDRSVSEVCRMP